LSREIVTEESLFVGGDMVYWSQLVSVLVNTIIRANTHEKS